MPFRGCRRNRSRCPGSTDDAARFVLAIEDLAHGLGDHDALVLFPEGGNFSKRRRLAAIERLVREGHLERAEAARQLVNLITPRPGGVFAAMRGGPDDDVVFVAHTGPRAPGLAGCAMAPGPPSASPNWPLFAHSPKGDPPG